MTICSWSCRSILRVLHLHYKVAILQLELRKCTSSITRVLQSCDFPAGAAEVYFAYYACATKLRFSSWSCGSVLRILQLYYKVAIIQLELRKCTSRTTLVLQSCDFPAGAAEVYFAYYACATKLRCSSWSCASVLRVLHVYYKVAIFQLDVRKCTSRATLVLQSCDFPAGAAEVYFAYYTCTTKLRFCNWGCGSVLRVLHLYFKVAIFQLELRKCTSRTTRVLQSCDFPAGAAEVYFAYYTCTTKLRFCNWGCGSVLRVLRLYYKVAISAGAAEMYFTILRLYLKVAIFELDVRKCTSRATLVLQSCDFPAGAAEVYFAYYTCTTKLRFCNWGCGSVLRVLRLYYKVAISAGAAEMYFTILRLYLKVAIFELDVRKCTSLTTLVLQMLHLELELRKCTSRAKAAIFQLEAVEVYYKAAIFQLELWKCTSPTTLALQSCDFPAGAAEV